MVKYWVPDSKYGQNRQKYILKLEIIRYKCHSDTVMSYFDSKRTYILQTDFAHKKDKSVNCFMAE